MPVLVSGQERRGATRMGLKLPPVRVQGRDSRSRDFNEEAFLCDISSSGALLKTKNTVKVGADLSLTIDQVTSALVMDAKAVRVTGRAKGAVVGVAFDTAL